MKRQLTFHNRRSDISLVQEPAEYYIVTDRLDTENHDLLFHALTDHIGNCYSMQMNFGHPFGAVLSVKDIRSGHYDRYADKCHLPTGEFICKEAVWDELTVTNKDDYITKISMQLFSH